MIVKYIFFAAVFLLFQAWTVPGAQEIQDSVDTSGELELLPTQSPKPTPRIVDGYEVPPFGFSLETMENGKFSDSKGFFLPYLQEWPDIIGFPRESAEKLPLMVRFGAKNSKESEWVEKINAWYQDGTAAGLLQDTFRSYDNGHSGIPSGAFPQLNRESAISDFGVPGDNIFRPRVTMGVQSYGKGGQSVIEFRTRRVLKAYYDPSDEPVPLQRFYKLFYENNFLFVAPGVGSFTDKMGDQFSHLSPYYLHSVGASGTDSKLLYPLVLASSALPPALKTRILRNGLFVPTLMQLFKSSIDGDIQSPRSHVPAYSLPKDEGDTHREYSRFLEKLLTSAHELSHIPPVSRLRILDVSFETDDDDTGRPDNYFDYNTYSFTGALQQGQTLVLTVDLRYSWTDENRDIKEYATSVLRGDATITSLNEENSKMTIRIPWLPTNNKSDLRTDLMFLVKDDIYFSAPAYLSIRHIHRLDPIILGIKRN